MKNERIFRGAASYYERVEGIELGQRILDFLSINLPPICNYRCEFCLAGMNQNRQKLAGTLSNEEYKRLIDEAHELGILQIEISGEGEPFLFHLAGLDIH